ncbi:hypothetical protein DT076_08950 [Desertihabitans brevis]|uniref:HTTM domain-containing protein n=1 Tax=Desertihabitans brevis TaxID=2268447 RepID=A0A367YUM9_9ACTN|nr:hypothetical protein [Desertihabitans brevis]RCK69586.1 hypothetical protein DT076_08950 [Desertihabitans brevis]
MSRLDRLQRGLDQTLLPSAPATRPALLRIVNGVYTGVYLARRVRMFRRVHRTDPSLFAPVGPVRVLRRPLPPVVADGLLYAGLAADVAFTAGLWHRVTGPAHAALLLWTLSYRNSWSMVFHHDNALVLHTAVLGCTPSADALSVDALHTRAPRPDSWRYGTPGRVMEAVTAASYLVTAIAKVKGPLGWSWVRGESLRSQIAADALRKALLGEQVSSTGTRLYPHTRVFTVLAAGSLALELAAPLALLDRRLARLWSVGVFGLHWGIKVVMGIRFRHHLTGVIYAPSFPLERLLPLGRRLLRRR